MAAATTPAPIRIPAAAAATVSPRDHDRARAGVAAGGRLGLLPDLGEDGAEVGQRGAAGSSAVLVRRWLTASGAKRRTEVSDAWATVAETSSCRQSSQVAQVRRSGQHDVAGRVAGEQARQLVGDVGTHGIRPGVFSSNPASRWSPREVRVFTVPSGMSSAAAISTWV